MDIKVKIAGNEYNPESKTDVQLMLRLEDENSDKMNDLFKRFFGLDPRDRYMGSFPYPDKETGACRVSWCLSMGSCDVRNAIVACLRAVIREAGLPDIEVIKKDSPHSNRWPADMEILATGSSINNNLVGEQRIQAALSLLEVWLMR